MPCTSCQVVILPHLKVPVSTSAEFIPKRRIWGGNYSCSTRPYESVLVLRLVLMPHDLYSYYLPTTSMPCRVYNVIVLSIRSIRVRGWPGKRDSGGVGGSKGNETWMVAKQTVYLVWSILTICLYTYTVFMQQTRTWIGIHQLNIIQYTVYYHHATIRENTLISRMYNCVTL